MLDPVSPTVQTSVGPPATLSSDEEKGRMRTVTVTFSVFEPPGGFAVAGVEAAAAVEVVAAVVGAEECGSRCEVEAGEACAACWVANGGNTGLAMVVGVDTEILRRLVVVPGKGVVVVVGVLEPAWWV